MKDCNQCDKCCFKYSHGGLTATVEEIESWRETNLLLYQYVKDDKIWMVPKSGKQLALCPWLQQTPNNKYTCPIYFNRPEDCRHYPVTIQQMIDDECEMIEVFDLLNPKRAQRKLDQIMADSRPPLSAN